MDYIFDIFLISISAALINNFVLYYFVGICPFIGISRRVDMALGIFGGAGFTIAIVIMAGIREELDLCEIPAPFKGAAITLMVGGILAMAFMGFTGVDIGLKVLLAGAP